jgi:putative lipoic acid-binding regulatory protein
MKTERESELRELLDKQHNWPEKFLFKFIYKSNPETEKKLISMFDDTAEITIKKSKKENYNSMSVVYIAKNSEDVLNIYGQVSEIEGVISL